MTETQPILRAKAPCSVLQGARVRMRDGLGASMQSNLCTFTHTSGETYDVKYVPQIRMDNVEAVYQLARQGIGLAAPPARMAAEHLATPSLTPSTTH